jgi:hypothetical protein
VALVYFGPAADWTVTKARPLVGSHVSDYLRPQLPSGVRDDCDYSWRVTYTFSYAMAKDQLSHPIQIWTFSPATSKAEHCGTSAIKQPPPWAGSPAGTRDGRSEIWTKTAQLFLPISDSGPGQWVAKLQSGNCANGDL